MKILNLKDYDTFSQEKMKKLNLYETPRFFCDVYCFEPGQFQKPHTHADQDKLYFVLEGEGTFQIGSDREILREGQGTMAPAGEDHGVVNHSSGRLRVLVFMAPNPG